MFKEKSNSILRQIKGITDLDKLTDMVTAFFPLNFEKKLTFMLNTDYISRAKKLITEINIEKAVVELENKIEEGAIISTDKRSNYKTILKLFNVRERNAYQSNTKENYKNLGNINSLHSRFKNFIRQMHGMATRRLENYLVWFTWIENFKRNENKNELIINSLSINKYDTTIREYKNTPYLYMEYWNS